MVGQLLLGLSILVGVHEWGHLIAAKTFGMRVEKYSIGFPPKIWGRQFGETEYSIGAIPLGGFVKISGMIDESLDTKSLSAEPQPWEFRAKPAWQRLIVMMGGIIVNVITGIIIFIVLAFINGETYITKEELNKNGIVAYELGEQLGFRTGDRVLSINGRDFERLSDIVSLDLLLGSDNYYTVERNGQEIRIDIPNDFIDKVAGKKNRANIIGPIDIVSVEEIQEGSNAEKGGLLMGDKFVAVNDKPVTGFGVLVNELYDFKGDRVNIIVSRNGVPENLVVDVNEDGKLGFIRGSELNFTQRKFGFFEAVSKGTYNAFTLIWLNIKGLQKIFTGDINPRNSVMGPIGIMKQFGGNWDWLRFWSLVGMLSMVLAFMNFLPIPALDGGHVMFLTWEIITGRKPSDRFLENAQKFGMVIVLSILAFAIVNDIISI